MSAASVSSVTPFDFRSDFETVEDEPDKITLRVSELAALLARPIAVSTVASSVGNVIGTRAPCTVIEVRQFMYVYSGFIASTSFWLTRSAIPIPVALPLDSSVSRSVAM